MSGWWLDELVGGRVTGGPLSIPSGWQEGLKRFLLSYLKCGSLLSLM